MQRILRWLRALPIRETLLALGVIAAIEVGLRAFGYGYPIDFFVPLPGGEASSTNPNFPYRYFLPSYQIRPAPVVISRKPSGKRFRVFVFGGSAPFGDVAPEYAFSRFLDVLLRARFPGASIQVVNAALPGIDSGVVTSIAREAAALGSDCFVVYMGNNEVVGPHGVASVVGALTPGGAGVDSWFVRFGRWLRGLRLAQWLDHQVEAARSRFPPPMLEPLDPARYLESRVHSSDPRLERVYASFRANLEAIVATARRARIPVVLTTVPSNVVDASPIASLPRPDLAAEERERFTRALTAGVEREQSGALAQALEFYERASAIDDEYADVQFRLARTLLLLGRIDEARARFLRARDVDAQRYRASTRINDTIRQVGADREEQGLFLVDLERVLERRARSPVGLPGEEFFYDHAHLSFAGNYMVARALLEPVAAIAASRLGREPSRAATPGLRGVGERLAFTEWDRLRVDRLIAAAFENPLLAGRRAPPFAEPGPEETDWSRPLKRTRALLASLDAYRSAIARRPDDLHLRRNAASLLADVGRYDDAVAELDGLLARVPNVVEWWSALGEIHLRRDEAEQAVEALRSAVVIDSRDLAAQLLLGDALRAVGDSEGAVRSYRRALLIHPYLLQARARLAFLLFDEGRYREAIPQLESVLLLNPGAQLAEERLRDARQRSGGPGR